MTEKPTHEQKPWQPKVDRDPEFNPFVNPQDRTGALENPPPLSDEEDEDGESA
jgi:hypothetical protein